MAYPKYNRPTHTHDGSYFPAMYVCSECGTRITSDDCFCDGMYCRNCGAQLMSPTCDGRCEDCEDSQTRQERMRLKIAIPIADIPL